MKPDAKPTTRRASDDTATTMRAVRVNVIDLLAIGMSVASHDGAVSEQSVQIWASVGRSVPTAQLAVPEPTSRVDGHW